MRAAISTGSGFSTEVWRNSPNFARVFPTSIARICFPSAMVAWGIQNVLEQTLRDHEKISVSFCSAKARAFAERRPTLDTTLIRRIDTPILFEALRVTLQIATLLPGANRCSGNPCLGIFIKRSFAATAANPIRTAFVNNFGRSQTF